MRMVETREPVAGVFVLTLRPAMCDFVRTLGRRLDEEKTVPRMHDAVADGDRRAGPRGDRRFERDVEFSGTPFERLRRPVQFDGGDLQIDGIQRKARDVLVERAHRRRANSIHRFAFEIGREMEVDMFDLHGFVRSVLEFGAGSGNARRPLDSSRKLLAGFVSLVGLSQPPAHGNDGAGNEIAFGRRQKSDHVGDVLITS